MCAAACFACRVNAKLSTCVRCGKARYCSKKCQIADWSVHRAVCKPADAFTGLIRLVPDDGGMIIDMGIITITMDPTQPRGWNATLMSCVPFRKEVYSSSNAFSYADTEGPCLTILASCANAGISYGQMRRMDVPRVPAKYVDHFLCANMVHFWHMFGWDRQYVVTVIERNEVGRQYMFNPAACKNIASKKVRPAVGMKVLSMTFPKATSEALLELLAALPTHAIEHVVTASA